jgi:hypothetical protein
MTQRSTGNRQRGVTLTTRDTELLEALARFGVLERSHIQSCLEWNCVSDVNRRLMKLFAARYLDRRFLPPRFGLTPAAYFLGERGVEKLATNRQMDLSALNRRRFRLRNMSDGLLLHEILISEFGCALQSSLTRHQEADLLEWHYDEELVGLCNVVEKSSDIALKPDGYGIYQVNGRRYQFFLEADRGTEPLSRIREKVNLYRSLKISGLFKENFGCDAFRVYFVTEAEGRALSIAEAVSPVCEFRLYIGRIGALRVEPLFSSVWVEPGSLQKVRLHDAGSAAPKEADE